MHLKITMHIKKPLLYYTNYLFLVSAGFYDDFCSVFYEVGFLGNFSFSIEIVMVVGRRELSIIIRSKMPPVRGFNLTHNTSTWQKLIYKNGKKYMYVQWS